MADGLHIPGRLATWLAADPQVSLTSPTLRGTWITAHELVALIVDGWTWADILRGYPELTEGDIRAALTWYMNEGDPMIDLGTATATDPTVCHARCGGPTCFGLTPCWTTCPVCGVSIREGRLAEHVAQAHAIDTHAIDTETLRLEWVGR